MSSEILVYHIAEDELQEIWELTHEEHSGTDPIPPRFCNLQVCLLIRRLFNNGPDNCSAGEGSDDD